MKPFYKLGLATALILGACGKTNDLQGKWSSGCVQNQDTTLAFEEDRVEIQSTVYEDAACETKVVSMRVRGSVQIIKSKQEILYSNLIVTPDSVMDLTFHQSAHADAVNAKLATAASLKPEPSAGDSDRQKQIARRNKFLVALQALRPPKVGESVHITADQMDGAKLQGIGDFHEALAMLPFSNSGRGMPGASLRNKLTSTYLHDGDSLLFMRNQEVSFKKQ